MTCLIDLYSDHACGIGLFHLNNQTFTSALSLRALRKPSSCILVHIKRTKQSVTDTYILAVTDLEVAREPVKAVRLGTPQVEVVGVAVHLLHR